MGKNFMIGRLWRLGIALCVTLVLSISCHRYAPAPGSPLLVAAASSLQAALQEIDPLYRTAHLRQNLNYNFAASGILQQQIARGAPADIFISAAAEQMDAIQSQGLLLPETRANLLTNRLVLITPKSSPGGLNSFQQLDRSQVRRIAIGEPRTVPAGSYATEVLKKLGIFDRVKSKFVLANNVRAVVTAVATGSVDAGIVYLTDAQSAADISIVATADAKLHSPIVYPIAILKSSKSPQSARAYLQFLQSQPAIAIFKKYGFGTRSAS